MKTPGFPRVLTVLAATLIQSACLTGPDEGDGNGGTHGARPNEVVVDRSPLRLTLRTDAETYEAGEPVHVDFLVRNAGGHDHTLHFRSGQESDIAVHDARGSLIANDSFGKLFTMALHDRTLPSGESAEYRWTWDQTDNAGAPVPAGKYEIMAGLADLAGHRSGTLTIEIRAD